MCSGFKSKKSMSGLSIEKMLGGGDAQRRLVSLYESVI